MNLSSGKKSLIMKSVFVIALIGCILFLLHHLENTDPNGGKTIMIDGTEQAYPQLTDEDFTVTEYAYIDGNSRKNYIITVENNSDYTIDFDGNARATEVDGSDVGTSYNRINSIAPGDTGCLEFLYDSDYAEHFKYELYYEVSDHVSAMDSIVSQERKDSNSVVVSCTNTGKEDIAYLRADILFFRQGELISYDFSYIHETNSSDIEAGSTLEYTFECDEDFDEYRVHYSCQVK